MIRTRCTDRLDLSRGYCAAMAKALTSDQLDHSLAKIATQMPVVATRLPLRRGGRL
jgi:hypothetical protein